MCNTTCNIKVWTKYFSFLLFYIESFATMENQVILFCFQYIYPIFSYLIISTYFIKIKIKSELNSSNSLQGNSLNHCKEMIWLSFFFCWYEFKKKIKTITTHHSQLYEKNITFYHSPSYPVYKKNMQLSNFQRKYIQERMFKDS